MWNGAIIVRTATIMRAVIMAGIVIPACIAAMCTVIIAITTTTGIIVTDV